MTDFIRIQPAKDRLVDMARWAVDQDPKVRTVSPQAFAVPAHLFTGMPEALLIGSTVDGHRYISPDDGQEQPPAGEGGPELLGVATADGFTESKPGEPLPDLPDSAYGPDAVRLDAAPADDPSDPSDREVEPPFGCGLCERNFTTVRGRDTHRRQAHAEA